MCAGSSARPLTYSHLFNYGGELYVADYTINEGVDLSICNGDDSFVTGLDGWTGGANSGEAWVAQGGVCMSGANSVADPQCGP